MSEIFYRDRAAVNKPKTADEIARAAQDLATRGFSDHTIAHVLAMEVDAVRQMIGKRTA